MPDLFVYGTLRFPDVLSALLGRVPERVQASVPGWRVAALPGRVYPGLVRADEAVAHGDVLVGLSVAELELLHDYEGVEYDFESVTLADGESVPTYIWRGETLAEDWDPGAFEALKLTDYLSGLLRG